MLKNTNWLGMKRIGEVHEIPDDVAIRWGKNKIAALPKAKTIEIEEVEEEPEELEEEVEEVETPDEEDDVNVITEELRNESPAGGVSGNRDSKPAAEFGKANKKGK